MPKLVFSRHGLSEWNALNQFTGWVDVDLAPEGVEEAKEGGRKIKEAGIEFDIAYTSVLKRAIKTCNYILEESDQLWVPQIKSWRLNERHYGALQGLNKKETAEKYGDEQVHIWRRSYDTLPPLLDATDPGSAANDRRYAMLDPRDVPGEESGQLWIPETKSWRLNERHYGALQGKNKADAAEKYGDEQVHIWRRSYDTLPPLLDATDPGSAANDRRYAMLDPRDVPGGENLKVTLERALPFWQDEIAPALKDNKTVLVAAHGNSLRALAKHIEGISDDDIMDLEIPTGQPLVYELNDDLTVAKKYYL